MYEEYSSSKAIEEKAETLKMLKEEGLSEQAEVFLPIIASGQYRGASVEYTKTYLFGQYFQKEREELNKLVKQGLLTKNENMYFLSDAVMETYPNLVFRQVITQDTVTKMVLAVVSTYDLTGGVPENETWYLSLLAKVGYIGKPYTKYTNCTNLQQIKLSVANMLGNLLNSGRLSTKATEYTQSILRLTI